MTEPLRILQWNSRSLYRAKLEEFRANLKTFNPLLALISETNWRNEYKVKFTAYNVFSFNRQGPGGGVAILAKKSLRISKLHLPPINNFETIGITVELADGTKLDIISAYCPNGNNCHRDDINLLFNSTGNTAIIGGDFNAHHPIWEDGHPSNKCGRILADILLEESNFILTTPKDLGTRPGTTSAQPATIDLTFMSPDIANLAYTHLGPYWSSDHLPVIIDLQLKPAWNISPPPTWRFVSNKWATWNDEIGERTQLVTLEQMNARDSYNLLATTIIDLSNKYFQPKRKKNPKEAARPWWTKECVEATKATKKAYETWRRTLLTSDKTALNRLEARKKKIINKAKDDSLVNHTRMLEKTKNTKAFWNFTKTLLNGQKDPWASISPLQNQNGTAETDPASKAAIFLDFYCPLLPPEPDSTRTRNYEETINEGIENEDPHPLNTSFSHQELKKALENLPKKAMGIDKIHNSMLTHLSPSNRTILLFVLNKMFSSDVVLDEWKCAKVVPLLKQNKPADKPDSYRPISLTSCLVKAMEKMLNC